MNLEERLFESTDRGGPWWLWAYTCPTPGCACRDAVILASREGPEPVLDAARAYLAAKASDPRPDGLAARSVPPEVRLCYVSIDGGFVSEAQGKVLHPEAAAAGRSLRGVHLDRIHALWWAGKGQAEQHDAPPDVAAVAREWAPDELLPWSLAHPGHRPDIYVQRDLSFAVEEYYCGTPGCPCEATTIAFTSLDRSGTDLGHVEVDGGTVVQQHSPRGGDVGPLWKAFQRRYPDWVARFTERRRAMQVWGQRLLDHQAANPLSPLLSSPPPEPKRVKVGRNDDCPCGSGKKYKKCCLQTGAGWS